MSPPDTRSLLVELLKQHQLENGLIKLGIAELSMRAGITRQAFNRYYSDLKPYCQGQSIAQLLADNPTTAKDFIAKRESEVDELREEIRLLKIQHQKDIEQAVNKHVTSLMCNDIFAFEANEVSTLLVKQSQHNEMLKRQLTQMELKVARGHIVDASSELTHEQRSVKSQKNFLVFPLDLTKAQTEYQKTQDFDTFEDNKEAEIQNIVNTIKKLPDHESIEMHLFQERYISSFEDFTHSLSAKFDKLVISMRLPMFEKTDIGLLLNDLKTVSRISIHVPYVQSEAIAAANRKFMFRGVPLEEFTDADKASTPQITWGFDEVHIYRVR
ncbi:hypothetical protein [Pseudomonas sp. SDO55104_S430]